MTIIADTSGVFAALDRDSRDYAACAAILRDKPGPFVLSPYVAVELDYMTLEWLGLHQELDFLEDAVSGRYVMADWTADDAAHAVEIVNQYRDMKIGIADASNVVLAYRFRTTTLLSLDGHYRQITPLIGADAFTLLPADDE